ncbi:MAG: DMT family transporter [Melioribacteraceae bacterium]|nr:DMT family transporter [Melioribacteraceae bacterium]
MNWFVLSFISAIFSAAGAITEKKSLLNFDPLRFSFWSSFVTLIFTIPFFFYAVYPPNADTSLNFLFFKTILSAGAFYCVMISIKNLEISEALPLLALSPGFIAVFGVLLIGDDLSIQQWSGILLMLVGTYVLELKKGNNHFFDPIKNLFTGGKYNYIIIALFLFTATSLIDRVLLKDFKLPPYTFMAYQQLFYVVIFGAALMVWGKRSAASNKFSREMVILLLLVGIFTLIYRYTQIEAVKLAPVALVISVKRLSILFAIIAGGRIFKEDNISRRITAAILIIAGTALLA